MKRSLSLVLSIAMTAAGLVACTPKPPSAKPVVEDFFEAVEKQDFEAAAQLTDNPSQVSDVLERSWKGLQAEGFEASLDSLKLKNTIGTVDYTLSWELPRERSFEYSSSMTLNRINDQWTIRWQPSALHPQLGSNQHLELRAINAKRASVISSDGAEVLVPGSVWRLLVDLPEARDRAFVATSIANALNAARRADESVPKLDAAKLQSQLASASGTYSVITLSEKQAPAVQEALRGVSGVRFNEEAAMVSTDPNFAPDIVKRVAAIVDEELDGANGWQVATVNADGARIGTLEEHAPQVAPAVRISLDHNVQRAAEEAVNIRSEMQTMIVAIRPSTGEILAVAQSDEADKQGDIALNGQYPPGSTFKIVTALAGLERRGLHPDSIVPCPGTMNIYGRIVSNYNQFSLGNTSLQTAFARSCNTTFADISTQLAPGELKAVGKQFGLGVDYDIPGLNTMTGSIPEGEVPLDRTEAGYGQGLDLASPFGMALVSATAAAGRTPTPTLISGHETKKSEEVPPPSPESIEELRRLMRAVVLPGGTAGGMRAGGEIFAKTGEAEITGGSHAWFTGYRDDLAFATLVVLGGGSEISVAITDAFLTRLDELNAGGEGIPIGEAPAP